MGERRGHPVAAAVVVAGSLVVTALLGGGALLMGSDLSGLANVHCYPNPCEPASREGAVVLGVLAACCLVGGLALALRLRRGSAQGQSAAARRGFWGRLSAAARPIPLEPLARPLQPPAKRHRGGGRR